MKKVKQKNTEKGIYVFLIRAGATSIIARYANVSHGEFGKMKINCLIMI